MPKLEELAKELESLGKDNLKDIIAHVRDDNYDHFRLVKELTAAKCTFFAWKLRVGAYGNVTVPATSHKILAIVQKRQEEKAVKLKAKAERIKASKAKAAKESKVTKLKSAIKNDIKPISETSEKN